MEHTYTIQGTYGSQLTPCDVFVYEDHNGLKWYATENSELVNATFDPIEQGVDVETLMDTNCFTWGSPITSESELENAVND